MSTYVFAKWSVGTDRVARFVCFEIPPEHWLHFMVPYQHNLLILKFAILLSC